ncbi:M1 family metallopeptidase [Streptomyces naganishii]|uniref:Aminopeptidase N n=1 Tax=Streptomyces naganishii JCM 4654 TaxID=1306179 RepID=A0A918Y1U6_9ACTN|nr:M1 family metallopeptidase [Streptomyces naganishii]GHD87089.1 metallopeptidase [Streptomyces naganishii JCM 4654]
MARITGPVTMLVLVAAAGCTSTARHPDETDNPVPAAERGAAGVGDRLFPTLGNGGYDVTHYDLKLEYAPSTNHLKGTAVITARATSNLRSFNLDFAGMKVRNTKVDNSGAAFSRAKNELTVTPAKTLRKGDSFRAEVAYDGTPRTIDGDEGWIETDDGSTALGQPVGSMVWFPGNHHPCDKASYDITVSVPKDESGDPYDVVANGELVGRKDEGDRTTSHWRSKEPAASYLANVSVGYFQVTKGKSAGGVPLYIAMDPREAKHTKQLTRLVPRVTDWAAQNFGPYPFSTTGAVLDHHPGLGYALETQTKPYFDSAPDEKLLVHELAHQWFGNSVTPKKWKDVWLNEGLATYAEWLWDEQQGNKPARDTFMSYYRGTHPESDGIWDFPPADPPSAEEVLDPPVYGRGAMVIHKLREAVGDEVFFRILRTWTKQHRHGNADTGQFIALCRQMAGKDLSKVFDVWLFGKNKPSRP